MARMLLRAMPGVAALVIGNTLARFNMAQLHHSLWLSLLYGYAVPLLLSGYHYWETWRDEGAYKTEAGYASLAVLVAFLLLWPPFVRGFVQERARESKAAPVGRVSASVQMRSRVTGPL